MLMARSYNKPARAAVPTDVVLEMVEPLDRVRGQVQGLSSTTDRSPPIPAGLPTRYSKYLPLTVFFRLQVQNYSLV
jgi:hypothetical protein